jgi:hypothetical protein
MNFHAGRRDGTDVDQQHLFLLKKRFNLEKLTYLTKSDGRLLFL